MLIEAALYISSKVADSLYEKLLLYVKEKREDLAYITDTFGDPLDLARTYIEPNYQNINPANTNEEEPDAIATAPIFKKLNTFFNGSFKTPTDGRNQLFILSDAGMGKTSLLMVIKLSHLIRNKIDGLWDTNKECAILKIGRTTIEDISQIKNKDKTILLLDALDEDAEAWENCEQRIRQLLDASHTFYRVIISCRTQFFPEKKARMVGDSEKVEVAGYKCPLIYLSLFDSEQVDKYLVKKYPDHETNQTTKQSFLKSKSIIGKIGTLSLRPLLLSHIDDLIKIDQKVWNEFTAYDALLDIWLSREQRKPNSKVDKDTLAEASSILACAMQAKGRRELEAQDLKYFLQIYPALAQLHHVDLGGRSLLNKNSKGEFRFSHYTIQEFLIAGQIIKPNERLSTYELRITDKILGFLSGYSLSRYPLSSDFQLQPGQHFLINLNLSSHNLSMLKLIGTDFTSSDLSNCRIHSSNLACSNLKNTNLSGADLTESDLTSSKITRSKVKGANLSSTIFDKSELTSINFSDCLLDNSFFRFCYLKQVKFINNATVAIDFKNSKFMDCVFNATNFNHCSFEGAVFINCQFIEIRAVRCNLSAIKIEKCTFTKPTFLKCDFKHANLSHTILDEGNYSDSNFTDAKLIGTSLKNANLRNSTMKNTDLTQANFLNSSVEGISGWKSKDNSIKFLKTILPDGKTRNGPVIS